MFTHSYRKATTDVLQSINATRPAKSSVLRWLQKHDDDEDKSWTAAGREFQTAGPQTAKVCDP